MLNLNDFYLISKVNRLIVPFAAFFLGFLLAGGGSFIFLFFGLFTILLIYVSAASANDIFDYEIDSISNPSRPIPSKKITNKSAFLLSIIFVMVGLVIAFILSFMANKIIFFWLMLLEVFLGYAYS